MLLRLDPALARGGGRAGLAAWLRLDDSGPDERLQPLERRPAILLLTALVARADEERAVLDDPAPREAHQSCAHRRRKRAVLRQQEAQLDRTRHLVDVLAAGT